jgi:hypothetical protein
MLQNQNEQHVYITPDTALASYLIISDIKKLRTDRSQNPTVFIFEDYNGNVAELVQKWERGIASGNVKAFFKTYKSLLKELKDDGNGNR